MDLLGNQSPELILQLKTVSGNSVNSVNSVDPLSLLGIQNGNSSECHPLSVSDESKPLRGSNRVANAVIRTVAPQNWCRTEVFEQVIRARGCRPLRVQNRFCFGQCMSYFIPQESNPFQHPTEPAEIGYRRTNRHTRSAEDTDNTEASIVNLGTLTGQTLGKKGGSGQATGAAPVPFLHPNQILLQPQQTVLFAAQKCAPYFQRTETVRLSCPGRKNKFVFRDVQIVDSCACSWSPSSKQLALQIQSSCSLLQN